jgi:hypothetical protein
MNPHLDDILTRLNKVRGRNGSWVACCPAHEDRSPSLTIRETPDGKILMHCFSGCSIGEIAGAIGVDLSDLFPPSDDYDYNKSAQRNKPRFIASDLLKVIAFESTVVAVAANDLAKGRTLSEIDRNRMLTACQRINEALEMSGAV